MFIFYRETFDLASEIFWFYYRLILCTCLFYFLVEVFGVYLWAVFQKVMELSECVIDGFSGSIHITAFLMSDLSDRLILHQHANPPLLNRGQLSDRFIQLCDLLIPYQGIFQRVPFIRFRHFQNILDRGPIAVINFFAVNTLGLILQGAPLVQLLLFLEHD